MAQLSSKPLPLARLRGNDGAVLQKIAQTVKIELIRLRKLGIGP